MMKFVSRLLMPGLLSLLLASASCTGEHGFEHQGMLRLPLDTLSFDTLFSNIGSTTARIKIYNPHQQKLLISDIGLKTQGNSGFRLSVDGIPSMTFSDVELLPRDSLYLFVEITAGYQGVSSPVLIEDAVYFITNGHHQEIILQAYAQDALIWRGKRIEQDTLLKDELPYLIYDSLVIDPGVTLSIDPGVRLHFHDQAAVVVYGCIKAKGDIDNPVIFRGDRLDKLFLDFPYEYYPGQWYGIYLDKESYGNEFDRVEIRGAYYGIIADSSSLEQRKLEISNSQLFNMVYSNLYSIHSNIRVNNSLLANSGSYTLLVLGGDAEFVHCTIANYQRLVNRDGPALALANFLGEEGKTPVYYPLQKADFINSIIYGSQLDELGLGIAEESAHAFFFRNCLIRNSVELAQEFAQACIYNEDPAFFSTGKDYLYNFRIDSLSAGINMGLESFALDLPFDLDGNSRVADTAPDLGAYEWSSAE
ncbi:MAG: hypothetical protein WCS66_03395 [Bacteroidales bacterium]